MLQADHETRIAATPAFPGLRRFPQGRGFKQWTGDDSKALMKVRRPVCMYFYYQVLTQCRSIFLPLQDMFPHRLFVHSVPSSASPISFVVQSSPKKPWSRLRQPLQAFMRIGKSFISVAYVPLASHSLVSTLLSITDIQFSCLVHQMACVHRSLSLNMSRL